MVSKILIGLLTFVLIACAGSPIQFTAPDPTKVDPNCNVYVEEYGINPDTSTGIIPKYIKNPCAARAIYLGVTRSVLLVTEANKKDAIDWIDKYATPVIKTGLSVNELKTYLITELAKREKVAGMIVLTLGDMFLYIPPSSVFQEDDVKLLNGALGKVKEEIQMFGN